MVYQFDRKIKQKKRGKRMFKGELWKNFCNYFEPFGRFNCFNKILPLVIPNKKVNLQIIKRRITEKKTAFCEEENDE